MKRFALLCLIPVFAVGCATRPVALSDAQEVPPDRVFGFQQSLDVPSGSLVVVRDVGYTGSRCPMAFYVDGVLAAHIKTGEVTTLSVPAGNRILGAEPAGRGLCTLGDETAHRRETSHAVETGKQTKVRLALTHEGIIQVTPTAF